MGYLKDLIYKITTIVIAILIDEIINGAIKNWPWQKTRVER